MITNADKFITILKNNKIDTTEIVSMYDHYLMTRTPELYNINTENYPFNPDDFKIDGLVGYYIMNKTKSTLRVSLIKDNRFDEFLETTEMINDEIYIAECSEVFNRLSN